MKKLSVLLAIVLLVMSIPMVASGDTTSGTIRGDVNGDGTVDALDYFTVKKYCLGMDETLRISMENADVNGDGTIDALDYFAVKSIVLNVEQDVKEEIIQAYIARFCGDVIYNVPEYVDALYEYYRDCGTVNGYTICYISEGWMCAVVGEFQYDGYLFRTGETNGSFDPAIYAYKDGAIWYLSEVITSGEISAKSAYETIKASYSSAWVYDLNAGETPEW